MAPPTICAILPADRRNGHMERRDRSRGQHNIGVTVFGGFAPFAITGLIKASGNKLAPGFYPIFCVVASLLALFAVCSKRKNR
jgi:peptidoglycan/LPS O-acetylase OafA/YrhL